MEDFSYEANMKLVKAGFTSIMHLAVLEGLKLQSWELEGSKEIIKFYAEDLLVQKRMKIMPQISFAFEGGWDLDYPRTVEMRTYGHGDSLRLDVKFGESQKMEETETRFCKEVVRLWKLCEKALLAEELPNISDDELNTTIEALKQRGHFAYGLKNRLDVWKDEDYKNGAMVTIVLARAVGVSPLTLAKQIISAFGNPFHKFPYVEVSKN